MVVAVKNERGAIAIQFALMLPILIIVVLGGFEVWKVLYVKQTLNDAAYQGVRLLSMQPEHEDIPRQVEAMIRRYAAANPFVGDAAFSPEALWVSMVFGSTCGSGVNIELALQWTVGQGGGPPPSGWFPFLGRVGRLRAAAGGVVLCEREEDVQ